LLAFGVSNISIILGVAFAIAGIAIVLHRNPRLVYNQSRIGGIAALAVFAGYTWGLAINAVWFALTGQPFPGESLSGVQQAAALGGVVLVIVASSEFLKAVSAVKKRKSTGP